MCQKNDQITQKPTKNKLTQNHRRTEIIISINSVLLKGIKCLESQNMESDEALVWFPKLSLQLLIGIFRYIIYVILS